jgi:hypothetical protein
MTPSDLTDPTVLAEAGESAEDRRWMRLVAADAIAEATPEEAAFVRDYVGEGRAARAEAEFLSELRERGATPANAASDAALVDAAVDRFLAGRGGAAATDNRTSAARPPTPTADRPRWRPRLLIGGGLTTAIAAAASWLLLVAPGEDVREDSLTEAPKVAVAEVEAPVKEPPPVASPGLRLLRGDAARDARPLAPRDALDDGPLALRPGACVGVVERFDACAREAAYVTLRGAAIHLDDGALAVESADLSATTVWVEVAGAVILTDGPSAYVIAVEAERWTLTVERGDVRVRLDDARELLLREGERLDGPPSDTTEETGSALNDTDTDTDEATDTADNNPTRRDSLSRPRSDPRTLLGEAQTARGAGDYRGAAKAYRRLIREHGETSIARTAQVSLGQLYLGPLGAPARAQRAFDAYLRGSPSGAMAEEALHGKIEALRRQRKDSAAAKASAEFLRRFPKSSYAAGIRRQLDAPE